MCCFLHLSYRGEPFHGWQRQPNAVSVQQTVEEALQTVLRVPVPIVGAGRTDTGVNARCMYAHFDLPEIENPESRIRNSIQGLNRLCGRDISIHRIIPVADDAHARFDAVQRTYKYFVTTGKSAFLHPLSWHSPSPLDVDAMNDAAATLLQDTDFTSFAKLHSDAKTNVCDVREARWERFLRNMVRAVVGTLVEVGRGKMSLLGFRDVVEARDRCSAGTSMPPQALTLWDVRYPYID